MKRRSVFVLVLAAIALAGVRAGAQQTVDDIIARNLAAKGGLDKLRAVQTLKQTSHLSGAMDATLVMYGKRPNLTRQEVTFAGKTVINAFDGQIAWVVNPLQGMASPMQMPAEQAEFIKQQAEFDGPLVDYKTKGYTIELVGTETVDGRRAHHLKVTDKLQRVQHCYIDAESNLESKVVSESPMGALEQILSDYRDVDGLKWPFLVRTVQSGQEVAKIQVEKVEFNARFDDNIFRMPKAPVER